MEKSLTLSQVLENMEFGEVAVKVGGADGESGVFVENGMYIYFDEKDLGRLKNNSGRLVVPSKTWDKNMVSKYVIMSREAYNKMKNL